MNSNIIACIIVALYSVLILIVDIVDILAYRRLNKRLDDIEEKYKGSEK